MEIEIYHKTSSVEGFHWWFVARRNIIDKIISELALPNGADILEIGCGSGGNLELLAKYGEVYTI